MLVVSNSSPLIGLSKIQHLDLLRVLFGEIHIPQAVFEEVVLKALDRPGARLIQQAEWIKVRPISNKSGLQYLLLELDNGEAEALILAQEMQADLLVMDESKGRFAANRLGISFAGTLGILLLAKQTGKLTAIAPLLQALRQENFHISEKVYRAVLASANE